MITLNSKTMKTRNILTAISVLMLALACVKEEHQPEVSEKDNFIKVNLFVPEIEVKASSAPVFYAHIPSQLQDGNVNPIAETVTNRNDGSKYYNLPIGTSAVAFTNLYDNTGAIDISADEVGNMWYSVDTEATKGSYFFSDEILAGYVSDVVPGTSEPYEVQIKRLSSKMTTYLRVKDENGKDMDHVYIIKAVSVEYSGIGGSASVLSDGTVSASGSHKQKVDMTYPSWSYYSHESNFIPTSEVPEVKVVITRESGMIQSYTASLGKVLEPNHHYTINLSVTNVNGGASFKLDEPEVIVSSPITPEVTEGEFFSTETELTIGGEAGNELLLDISTILPYEWTFEFDEISENYFTGEIVDGKLKLVTKEGNMGDIRYGNVILKSSVGNYTKVLSIRQMSAIKDEIIMTRVGSRTSTSIYITGENITVQDPDDSSPRFFKVANAEQVTITGLGDGKTVTVKGDIIKELICTWYKHTSGSISYEYHNGYYYSLSADYDDEFLYEFNNCRHLETFIGKPMNDKLDFKAMPQLKKVALGDRSAFTSISFAEGQGLESFTAYRCPNVMQLSLRNCVETLSNVTIYDCDNVAGVNFTDFKSLSSINLDECNNMGAIVLNGCSSLERFSVSRNSATTLEVKDCSSLKSVYVGENVALAKFLHEGSDAIEIVEGYRSGSSWYSTIDNLDLTGKKSLKSVSDLIVHTLIVEGCSNLTVLDHLISIKTLDMSNCTSIDKVWLDFWSSSQESYKFDNCPKLEDVYFEDITNACDFSPLTALRKLHLENITGTGFTSLDFSANTQLEDVRIDSDNGRNCKLNLITLPNSVKTFYMNGIYSMYSLDLSNHTNLKSIEIRQSDYINNLNVSGCSSLETLELYALFGDRNSPGFLNLSACSSLISINQNIQSIYLPYLNGVDLSGCSSLEYMNINDADITNLDLSDCEKVTYLDIRNNNMSAEALNYMFGTLPDWSVNYGETLGVYKITGNPGASSCNTEIAYVKNWNQVK